MDEERRKGMEGSAISAVSILSDSLGTLKDEMMSAIGAAAPVAMTIGGTIAVIFIGWKLFKRISK